MADDTMVADAAAFGAAALALVGDAASVLNSAFGLAGNFGRYAAATANPAISSESQAAAAAALARSGVSDAVVALLSAVGVRGDVPAAVQAVLDAVSAALASPADRLRAFTALTGSKGAGVVTVLCRRLSVVALAVAASGYAPDSYDDAEGVLSLVAGALDAEITAAGDAAEDASFEALRQLRVTSAADLTARGADLAPLVVRSFGESQPHLAVAALLYGDAGRADELVRRVGPVHPLFMPTRIQVLAR